MQTQQKIDAKLIEKKQQRKILLGKRRALTSEQKATYSAKIITKIIASDEYKNANLCFLFASMADEVQTKELILDAFKAGKRVCLPYITSIENKTMEATEIYSLDELVVGAYGILSVDEAKLRLVSADEIDFVLVPAVGFDRNGYRLGMGGGYYDRYLSRCKRAKLVSGIYACQLVDEIIKDEHDAKISKIFTEDEIILAENNN